MANRNIKTWRTVSHGTVALREGQTGHYLVIDIGLPTGEKPRPYWFSKRISDQEEAIAETELLLGLWEHSIRKEVNMTPTKKPTAVKGLRLFFSETVPNEAGHLVSLSSILLKDENEHMSMSLLFRRLLDENKEIPNETKYIWKLSPIEGASSWKVIKVVELISPRSIQGLIIDFDQVAAIYTVSS